MKKACFILLSCWLFVYGCKKPSVNNNGNNKTCYVTRSISAQGDTFTYEYDGNNYLIKKSYKVQEFKYSYSGGKIVKEEDYSGGALYSQIDYSYAGDSVIMKSSDMQGHARYAVYHLKDGAPISSYAYTVSGGVQTIGGSTRYTYSNGDLIKTESVAYNNGVETKTVRHSEYDDKKNPFYFNYDFNYSQARHNMIKSYYENSTDTAKNSYQYNSDGYPIQYTSTFAGASSSLTYDYNCK